MRPGLLGPLCRRDNWCEVAEVEETLAAREVCTFSFSLRTQDKLMVFSVRNTLSSLICIMSEKCIPKLWSSFASELNKSILRVFSPTETHYRLSEKETDMKDRLGPSITYLQRLSPEYLDTIFQYSKWILNENAEMALEVSSTMVIFYSTC